VNRPRKTKDEYEVHSYWNSWELVCTEDTLAEARKRLKEYRENEPSTFHRIVKKRVKIAEVTANG
jgi:hypothetical protein